jgi:hypothetical protein
MLKLNSIAACTKSFRLAGVGLGLILLTLPAWGNNVNDFRLIFPFVAKGSLGEYIESRIVITNVGAESVEVTLESEQFAFEDESASFELGPHEVREISLPGESFQVGAVRLISTGQVAGSAFIFTRASEDDEEILSEATVIATPPMARAAFPVFVASALAQDTGLALAYLVPGGVKLRFTLYDPAGQEIASREEEALFHPNSSSAGSTQASFFLSELFPSLPSEFSQGSLVVEALTVEPEIFSLTALYSRGTRFRAAEVATIDDFRGYWVKLNPNEPLEETAEALSETYGFEIAVLIDPDRFSIRSTREIARAVSRDPRVESVFRLGVVGLSATQ